MELNTPKKFVSSFDHQFFKAGILFKNTPKRKTWGK
jgi:hypothetical protein